MSERPITITTNEFEVNALNTRWELRLNKPYKKRRINPTKTRKENR
jgi:hypothetical protein